MSALVLEKISKSLGETLDIASDFISSIGDRNCILILSGDLGAGKTHFTKGIFKGLGFQNYQEITSPTFDLVNTFKINNLITHHFDLYRIDKLNQDDKLWLQELLNEDSLCIIEWGDKFNFQLNKKIYSIKIEYINENERRIKIFTN
jgi:tRNA threonylcarbamoyladenosine biosynthesis protein TsaE